MYIAKIKLYNFKGFYGEHELNFHSGINFFVGNNNCGKSSIFEAIDFIRTKKNKEEIISKNTSETDYVSVEIEVRGNELEDFITITPDLRKYQQYLIEQEGTKILRIMRSSRETEIIQNGKKKNLDIKNVQVFNPTSNQFENPTGIDSTITAIFDAQFVWADTNSNDVADFGKTKICGKIINTITKDFTNSPTWQNFQESHKETFGDGANSLSQTLKPVQSRIQNILSEQYGETEVKFSFFLPEIDSFFKTGNIELSDEGIQTKSTEKGTGMQRALALSLIQVYAEILVSEEEQISKPIMFLIDEPETFLHPQAQDKLLDSLEKISEQSQVFIVTHSPYLLKKYNRKTHSIHVFTKKDGSNHAEHGHQFNLFGSSSPSWGEINYFAFGVLSDEFHNELYGFIQAKAILDDEKYYSPKDFDKYLLIKSMKSIKIDREYIHLKSDGSKSTYQVTLPTKIRNIIHHPENTNNIKFTDAELKISTEALIKLLV